MLQYIGQHILTQHPACLEQLAVATGAKRATGSGGKKIALKREGSPSFPDQGFQAEVEQDP
jgi:hypothetical protein